MQVIPEESLLLVGAGGLNCGAALALAAARACATWWRLTTT
jgi:hypothetical protein